MGAVPTDPPSLWSRVVGVAHEASIAKSFRFFDRPGVWHRFAWPPPVMSADCGVGQLAKLTACPSVRPNPFPFPCFSLSATRRCCHVVSLSFCGPAFGVGHEPKSLSDVGRPDAASWKYGKPSGVAFRTHVSVNKVDPAPSNCCLNLLAKDDCRSCSADKSEPVGPQVAVVIGRLAPAGGAEGLAGTAAAPNRSRSPIGEVEGVIPARDSGKEMHTFVSNEVIRVEVFD